MGRVRAPQSARLARGQRVDAAACDESWPAGPILAVGDAGAGQWRSVEGRLAARYARLDAGRLLEGPHGQPRVLLRLVPERLIAWRGLLRPVAAGPAQRLRCGSAAAAG